MGSSIKSTDTSKWWMYVDPVNHGLSDLFFLIITVRFLFFFFFLQWIHLFSLKSNSLLKLSNKRSWLKSGLSAHTTQVNVLNDIMSLHFVSFSGLYEFVTLEAPLRSSGFKCCAWRWAPTLFIIFGKLHWMPLQHSSLMIVQLPPGVVYAP